MGDARAPRHHRGGLERGRPVSGHVYGREFVAAYAAQRRHGYARGHRPGDRRRPSRGWRLGLLARRPADHALAQPAQAIKARHRTRRAGQARLRLHRRPRRATISSSSASTGWPARLSAGHPAGTGLGMGSLHRATRYGLDGEIGGFGGGRRADIVLLDDALEPQSTWYGGELVVEDRTITPLLDAALSRPYRYPSPAYERSSCPRRCRASCRSCRPLPDRQRHPHDAARHRAVPRALRRCSPPPTGQPLQGQRLCLRHRDRAPRPSRRRRARAAADFGLSGARWPAASATTRTT